MSHISINHNCITPSSSSCPFFLRLSVLSLKVTREERSVPANIFVTPVFFPGEGHHALQSSSSSSSWKTSNSNVTIHYPISSPPTTLLSHFTPTFHDAHFVGGGTVTPAEGVADCESSVFISPLIFWKLKQFLLLPLFRSDASSN